MKADENTPSNPQSVHSGPEFRPGYNPSSHVNPPCTYDNSDFDHDSVHTCDMERYGKDYAPLHMPLTTRDVVNNDHDGDDGVR